MTQEIIGANEEAAEEAGFQIVHVRRDNVLSLASWPATGWSGEYKWLSGGRGPASPLIRPGDKISLQIWDNSDNSLLTSETQKAVSLTELDVTPGGTVFVPYAEDVRISGLSPDAARRKIQEALQPFIPAVQVQLGYAAGRENSVDLVSGVSKPGTYSLPDRNSSVLSMIAQGGGISSSLDNPLVRLMRGGKTYEIRADTLFADASYNTLLRGGDKIVVQEDQRYFTAFGASGNESLVHFQKEEITALEAMSLIGGLNDQRANPKGVLVLRAYEPEQLRLDESGPNQQDVVFVFNLTNGEGLFAARKFRIHPKDTVIVTESPVMTVRTVFGLLNTLLVTNNRF
ncbi:hypothetical protein CKO11_13915 [Rhodobacter sp. TJ_12]|uniref:polysaccharide biosynthesis/export family protein n=1 Tax=Rhodobacter sp. TJ_12 TaxID=2029399 RepID=UPI001CBEACA7|nr:polysaccharide biosynthesis/export family protein [Rhodobacter sp. TJ_12]MBZ4023554.1 hypothetical protein [Rhodobacter sp. TJ_12]